MPWPGRTPVRLASGHGRASAPRGDGPAPVGAGRRAGPRRASCSADRVARSAGASSGAWSSSTSRPAASSTRCKGDPFLPFRFTVNAYRGCSHACTYCFARPTHEYLGLDIGARLRPADRGEGQRRRAAAGRARSPPRGAASPSRMGTNTDPYQRCEGKYRLTRGIVAVARRRRQPVLDPHQVDARAARPRPAGRGGGHADRVRVDLSIGTLDDEVWRATEPGTPAPAAAAASRGAAERGRHPVRRARGAGPARPLRRPGAAARRSSEACVEAGRGVGVDRDAAPASGGAGPLPRRAAAGPIRRWPTSSPLATGARTGRRWTAGASATRCTGRSRRRAAWRSTGSPTVTSPRRSRRPSPSRSVRRRRPTSSRCRSRSDRPAECRGGTLGA